MGYGYDDYRKHPRAFFDLYASERKEILTDVYGPIESFVYRKILDEEIVYSMYYADKVAIEALCGLHMENQEWELAGMMFQFFNIRDIEFPPNRGEKHFNGFAKVFPFGCIDDPDSASENLLYQTCTTEWSVGIVDVELLKESFLPGKIDDDHFEFLVGWLGRNGLLSSRMPEILEVCLLASIEKRSETRVERVISVLSQKYLFFGLNDKVERKLIPRIPYLYMFDLSDRGLVPSGKVYDFRSKIPKPKWSRKNNWKISYPGFSNKCLYVIMMQKFRYDSFGLHRDLVDVVLGHLFDLEVEEMEVKLKERDKKINHLMACYSESTDYGDESSVELRNEVLQYCLKVGISIFAYSYGIEQWLKESIHNAVDLTMGYPLKKHVRDDMLENLKMTLYSTVHLGRKWKANKEDKLRIGDLALKFCEKEGIDLWNVLGGNDGERKVKLWLVEGERVGVMS